MKENEYKLNLIRLQRILRRPIEYGYFFFKLKQIKKKRIMQSAKSMRFNCLIRTEQLFSMTQ
ncbi:unnamed protein product [Paramecium sonneborni]|uniref:Uncharacterized protein n=1 Tax=Paramecium sonneborni TaxID=65129 RepID=A0A8S1LD32_9CILI|nr:unnamed protein product [Paramecium sonneborni]